MCPWKLVAFFCMNPVLITMLWYIIFIHSRFGGLSYRNTGNKNVQKCFCSIAAKQVENLWNNEYKLWKSYIIGTGGKEANIFKIIAVLDASFRKPEKMQAFTGFKPLTSAILVQSSTIWATSQMKTSHWTSLSWFGMNPSKDDHKIMNVWNLVIKYRNCWVMNQWINEDDCRF